MCDPSEAASVCESARNDLFNFPELFGVNCGRLFQLHWQNRADSRQTEFVGQGGHFRSFEEAEAWLLDLIERRHSECPDGWGPLVCDRDSEHFVLAPGEGG